jgi:hypothetical protein
MPRQVQEKVFVGADLLLINEGATSVAVAIDGRGEFNEGVGTFQRWFGTGENAKLPHRQAKGSYVVPPATKCLLLVRDGHSAETWISSPNRPVVVQLSVAAMGANRVEDRWDSGDERIGVGSDS